MRFELMVLGANSAIPMPDRFPSSFVLNHNENLILLDCGEGAQIKMSQYSVRRTKIDHVFISHLHGDHFFGLPGFLNSLNLNRREKALHIYGPAGIKEFLDTVMRLTEASLHFDLTIHEVQKADFHKISDIGILEVFAFPLKHRIPTFAYKFQEKKHSLNLDPDAIRKYSLTIEEIKAVKSGGDIYRSEGVIENHRLCASAKPRRSFAYCTDTIFDPSIIGYLQECDLLYHEATYMHELADKARSRMHATAWEASTIAQKARVKKLVIGHYSSRYKDLDPMLQEARRVFNNTHLAIEGTSFSV